MACQQRDYAAGHAHTAADEYASTYLDAHAHDEADAYSYVHTDTAVSAVRCTECILVGQPRGQETGVPQGVGRRV